MRPITGTDIIDFHASGYDLLVLTADGEYAHIDIDEVHQTYSGPRPESYNYVETDKGQVQVLLTTSDITDGEWFPDALDDSGDLIPSVADEMARIVTNDGILPSRALKAVEAGKAWRASEQETNRRAAARAAAVAEVAAYAGSQSAAAIVLGLDQSTVNKLVKKAKRTAEVGDRITVPAHAVPEDWPTTGEAVEVGAETIVVELDNGSRQELPADEVTRA
jgi:hypothetical protein